MKRSVYVLCSLAVLMFVACAKKTTVDDVVNKMTQALGGAEKLASIQDQVGTWDMVMGGVPMGDSMGTMNGSMVITYKSPNKIKFEGMGPDGSVMFATVFDGTSGWQMAMGQARDMSPAEIQESTTLAETWATSFHDYAKKGMTLMLMPDSTMNGTSYHVMKATDRFGNTSTSYCNAQTGLCERMDGEGTNPETQEKQAHTMTFSDYAAFDGVMLSKKVVSHDMQGNLMFDATLKEVKHNTGVSDEAFAKPMAMAPAGNATAQ